MPWIAWNVLLVMSNVTGITGKLCNKCPKWQVVQNSSYSDSFNAISGFTSNSRAPGGPVTMIAGKMHSQSPIPKTEGVLSNLVILTYLQTKLHHPYPNQTACLVYEFWSKKHLQCLKNVGLYNSFEGGRFSFWQSWLTWASRFASSQVSALNLLHS